MSNKNKNGLSRRIPESVKAEVRRECGFACVFCGGVPVQYDHCSVPFSEAEIHDPADIVLLCPTHHSMKTAGAISPAACFKARKIAQGKTDEARWKQPIASNDFECLFGSTLFRMGRVTVELAGEPVLVLEKGEDELEPIILSGTFRNHQGNVICQIERNELLFFPDEGADFKTTNNKLVLTHSDGRIALEMKITDERLSISKLEQFYRDAYCVVHEDRLIVGNARNQTCSIGDTYIDCETAISVVGTSQHNHLHPDDILNKKIYGLQMNNITMSNMPIGLSIN